MRWSFDCCGHCGKHWHKVQDPHYVAPPSPRGSEAPRWPTEWPQDLQEYATYAGWDAEPPWAERWNRPPSRSRDPSPRRQQQQQDKNKKGKNKGKGKGKNTQKGKGQGQQTTAPAIAPEPPWQSQATPAQPSDAQATNTAAETQLQQLVQALKKSDQGNLSADVQGLLATVEKKQAQTEVKHLYSAVGRLNQAQKQLQAAQQARTTLHLNWNSHLLAAVERWRGYANDFAAADNELTQQIAQAQESLRTARSTLADQRRSTANSSEVAETQLVSDTEEIQEEPDTRTETANAITDGINTMVNSLQELQRRAEDLLPPAKRPRREDDGQEATEAATPMETDPTGNKGDGKHGRLGASALQPFAKGRQQT